MFSYDDYRVVDGEPELFPPVADVPYLISETVGAAVDPQYRWFDPPATLANQAYAHALVHDQAQADPRYAGVLAWAAIDYYAALNPADPVAAAKNWNSMRTPGVLDVFRVPKPGASIYQSQVAPAVRPVSPGRGGRRLHPLPAGQGRPGDASPPRMPRWGKPASG